MCNFIKGLLWSPCDDLLQPYLDRLGLRRINWDLLRGGIHDLGRGESARADQLVNRGNAYTKPLRGGIGANGLRNLRMGIASLSRSLGPIVKRRSHNLPKSAGCVEFHCAFFRCVALALASVVLPKCLDAESHPLGRLLSDCKVEVFGCGSRI